jgi:hypothetical protein
MPAFEFVGGPLDGRCDIETPEHLTHYVMHTAMPIHVIQDLAAADNEIPDHTIPYKTHTYRRGSLRKCGPEWEGNEGYWQDIWWDAWIYEGFY